ncbi:PssE/Cps14G family polysaccharide biosynthesis glycosyltransferase [Colwellia sp. C1TZA3]|uniref:PssE/Cps14G family polysaccharide biosynthesis glycosyltransferase n=1 Tax=Colwellia sp. C1TZA3 TaxID=2508879 RepID=UPI0011B9C073|nr:PssE/Cps14G family polysaccharide biosynthesis glycosyltransferase [Colwellia sp. C1TZA3]TWX63302.1 hypothetical protein ESZ39_17060 [Colwellia sp. C1TZA3]
MKIFTTVGNTRFDALFKEVDRIARGKNWNMTYQISDGSYIPDSGSYFRFTDNIDDCYENADVVITHGGAGTIFKLLKLRKKIIVILNSCRLDPHQAEIVNYINENSYGLACFELNQLEKLLHQVSEFSPRIYKDTPFLKAKEIVKILDII